jgi:hypothetical protein
MPVGVPGGRTVGRMMELIPTRSRLRQMNAATSDLLDRLAAALRRLPPNRQARFLADLEQPPAPDDWIGAAAAARLLGCQPQAVRKLAATGRLTVRRLPCGRPRYARVEVEALARESTRPAQPATE